MPKILLVDAEQSLHALAHVLRKEGYDVATASEAVPARSIARAEKPDMIVLDVDLPGLDGLEVCRALRAETTAPILILSGQSGESDRMLGFELGADEYLVKPVGAWELVARIAALLHRARMYERQAVDGSGSDVRQRIECGPLRIDALRHEARWAGRELDLNPKEFELLLYLARNPGRVLTRESLLASVWGDTTRGQTRTVDVHICWLREKVEEDARRPKHLKTVRGLGYKLSL
ncbi:MAG TPA: response regulator transcription factor [Thermomicrobiales bacterium]|nr:response regulator transcription factor [Thermomicrobiales bacterium]